MVAAASSDGLALARQARERFLDEAAALLDTLPVRIAEALDKPDIQKTATRKFEAIEAKTVFSQKSGAWLAAARREWRRKPEERSAGKTAPVLPGVADSDLTRLTLVDNAEMDRTVAIGRLALAILDKAGRELGDLRARMQRAEGQADFATGDVLRPETFARVLLNTWAECGLTLAQWDLVQEAVHQQAAQGLRQAYVRANAFLMERGVTAEVDLRARVRRAPDRGTTPGALSGMGGALISVPATLPGPLYPTGPDGGYGPSIPGGVVGGAGGFVYAPPGSAGRAGYEAALYGGMGGGVAAATIPAGSLVYAPPGSAARAQYDAMVYGGGPAVVAAADAPVMGGPGVAVGAGTLAPAVVAVSPVGVLQQQRAQGVLGNLRAFALQHGVALAASTGAQPLSPVLAVALAEPAAMLFEQTQYLSRQGTEPATEPVAEPATQASTTQVDQAAERLKDEARALKDKAERPDEKATIEIVSLMFQAMLTDERLPPTLRAWFGRLQVPVLRVALAEPEFFAAPDHPARRLIDRMGACALGMDSAEVDGGRLEQEVKRIVQMIEQYPETGQKVFQVMLGEFEKFLGRALAQDKPAQKFATLAQQVEQKDALTIQYTIELRKMLDAVRVGEDVRQFLFRVWAEVLALAAVRRGAQDAQTMRFKQAAVDLLWAASPKADRAERQQIMQYLPGILKTLREGMQTLAMKEGEQDEHIRLINQAVTQAFNLPGQGITPTQMNDLARALTGLEDVVSDDPEGDLLLDPALLEQILGVEGQDLEVIAAGGVRPDADMLQWAREQQPGQWYTLRHQSAPARVQYVWRSARGQLHLFAAASGKSYLIQTRRLASWLQAGLITPLEREALTVRATRAALTRLGQAPELLLH